MAFIAALGALRAHQSWIDVIGNNLANSNTPGFKSSRAVFGDLLSITYKGATPPNGSLGGTNPMQVGLGMRLASVDRQHQQGALDATGRTFDLALQGRGFFAVTDGIESLYGRVGTFGLDAQGQMVDLQSGNRVLDANGSVFTIDTSAVLPPSATTQATLSGNLPAVVTGPLAEELTSSSAYSEGTVAQMTGSASGPFTIPAGETWTMELVVNGGAPQSVSIAGAGSMTAQELVDEINAQTEDVAASVGPGQEVVLASERAGLESSVQVVAGQSGKDLKTLTGLGDFARGTESVATSASDLNDLSHNLVDYQSGDQIEVTGSDVDGTPIVASFTYGVDGTTLGELVSFLDARFAQSTVAFDASSGRITVTANNAGEADLSLAIADGANQAGSQRLGVRLLRRHDERRRRRPGDHVDRGVRRERLAAHPHLRVHAPGRRHVDAPGERARVRGRREQRSHPGDPLQRERLHPDADRMPRWTSSSARCRRRRSAWTSVPRASSTA